MMFEISNSYFLILGAFVYVMTLFFGYMGYKALEMRIYRLEYRFDKMKKDVEK